MCDLIDCVVYECFYNQDEKCTKDAHGTTPNSMTCAKLISKRPIDYRIIEKRLRYKNFIKVINEYKENKK